MGTWRFAQLASSVHTTLQQRLPLGATDFQRLLNHVETQVPASGQELGTWGKGFTAEMRWFMRWSIKLRRVSSCCICMILCNCHILCNISFCISSCFRTRRWGYDKSNICFAFRTNHVTLHCYTICLFQGLVDDCIVLFTSVFSNRRWVCWSSVIVLPRPTRGQRKNLGNCWHLGWEPDDLTSHDTLGWEILMVCWNKFHARFRLGILDLWILG